MLFLMCATTVVDIAWIMYWGSAWNNNDDDSWISVLHHMVFIISIVEVLVKIGTIVLVIITEKENLVENLPQSLGNIIQKI